METLFSWLDQTINKNPVAALTVLVAISIFLFGYLLVRLQEQIRSLGDYVDNRESALNQKYKSLRDLSTSLLDKYIELGSRIEDPAFKGDLAIARELVTLVNGFMENCNTHFCRLDHHVDSLEGSLGNRLDEVESALETLEDTLKYGTASDTDAVKDELLDCIQAKEETAPAVSNMEGFSQPGKPLNSDKIPEGYRKLGDSVAEPRQPGDLRWSIAEKRYIEISGDEIAYANRDNWAACRKVEPAIKQSLTTEPPDGWRFLEVGEMIRNGDKPIFPGGKIKELPPSVIGKKHERPCRAYCHYIRRNRL